MQGENTSPRKTRSIHKREQIKSIDGEESTKCLSCNASKLSEEVRACHNCLSPFHLSCLNLQPETVAFFHKNPKRWHCPRCVRCDQCDEYIYDPNNVQCLFCGKSYHGDCRPRRNQQNGFLSSLWVCAGQTCRRKQQLKPHSDIAVGKSSSTVDHPTTENQQDNSTHRILRSGQSNVPLEDSLKKRRNNIQENLNFATPSRQLRSTTMKYALKDITDPRISRRLRKNSGKLELNRPLKRIISELLLPLPSGSDVKNENDFAEQAKLLEELGSEAKSVPQLNTSNEWIYFGPYVRFKPIYESPFMEPIKAAKSIYICEFCLTPLVDCILFKNHISFCPWKHPPGNEIYREGNLNIWEVEGSIETLYCRNLCLLSKLFLSSKTLFFEVETFTFYILTEITSRGCIFVGYFSKEKNPSKNNNLSCLLTLPSFQNKGYGKLLIDLSYQLSKKEHKIGSPEHPLSDLGLLAYRSYWRQVLFSSLRRRRDQHSLSIKDLSVETGIHNYDIVSTLLGANMIVFKEDNFFIDISKALNASLASLRRRSIIPDLLYWEPQFEVINGQRMNSYAVVD